MNRAILIGVADAKLPSISGELLTLADALSSKLVARFEDISMIGPGAELTTKSQIENAVVEFAQRCDVGDLALIYFGGHGRLDGDLRLLLHTSETDEQRLRSTTLDVDFIVRSVRDSKATKLVLILDCCYSEAAAFAQFADPGRPIPLVPRDNDQETSITVIASARRNETSAGGFAQCFAEALLTVTPRKVGEPADLHDVYNHVARRMRNEVFQVARKWHVGGDIPIGRRYPALIADRDSVANLLRAAGRWDQIVSTPEEDRTLDYIDLQPVKFGHVCRLGLRTVPEPTQENIRAALSAAAQAVEERRVDRAVIITSGETEPQRPLPHPCVRVVSMAAARSELHPLSDYLTTVIREYEDSDIHKTNSYIPLRAQREGNGKDSFVELELQNWLADPKAERRLVLLGDFGAGKSTLSRLIAYRQAMRHRAQPDAEPIPLIINLREFRQCDLQSLVERRIRGTNSAGIAEDRMLKHLNEDGRVLWILDGFDEMASGETDDRIRAKAFELFNLVKDKSRLVVTCRTHFFRTRGQQDDTFRETNLAAELREKLACGPASPSTTYRTYYLRPLGVEDIERFIHLRLKPELAVKVIEELRTNQSLRDLADRPILLDMIVQTVPVMQEAGEVINLASLYETYARIWLDRDRHAVMKVDDRFRFSMALAWYFFCQNTSEIHYKDLPAFVLQTLPAAAEKDVRDREVLQNDIVTSTFLHRDDIGNYSFAHRSFYEFFCAAYIADAAVREGPESLLGRKILPFEIVEFVAPRLLSQSSPRAPTDVDAGPTRVDRLREEIAAMAGPDRFNFTYFLGRYLPDRLMNRGSLHGGWRASLLGQVLAPASLVLAGLAIAQLGSQLMTNWMRVMTFQFHGLRYFVPIFLLWWIAIAAILLLTYWRDVIRGRAGNAIAKFNSLALHGRCGGKTGLPDFEERLRVLDRDNRIVAESVMYAVLRLPPPATNMRTNPPPLSTTAVVISAKQRWLPLVISGTVAALVLGVYLVRITIAGEIVWADRYSIVRGLWRVAGFTSAGIVLTGFVTARFIAMRLRASMDDYRSSWRGRFMSLGITAVMALASIYSLVRQLNESPWRKDNLIAIGICTAVLMVISLIPAMLLRLTMRLTQGLPLYAWQARTGLVSRFMFQVGISTALISVLCFTLLWFNNLVEEELVWAILNLAVTFNLAIAVKTVVVVLRSRGDVMVSQSVQSLPSIEGGDSGVTQEKRWTTTTY